LRPWERVVILCPAGAVSGGPEALHQLAGALRSRGVDASLLYYPEVAGGVSVPEPYGCYDVRVTRELDDSPSTLVVIPEVMTSFAWRLRHAQKAFWWLSVDNYFKWKHCNPGPSVLVSRPDSVHLCQSAYARRFLAQHGVGPVMMLSDYVSEGVFSGSQPGFRIPCVAYNPKKGVETTRRLIARSQGRQLWIPLEGMSKRDLAATLQSARIYVDFGEHPGRDRIPREAALCGALVITGRRGAAALAEDVPLPDAFRLDETAPAFETDVVATLDALLTSDAAFAAAVAQQDDYRAWIRGNKATFVAEVDELIAAGWRRGQPAGAPALDASRRPILAG
jgi:hypothetical protein